MLHIDKVWIANVNVWKRHLTLQSIFNRGESMMHADKNADHHVVDQNVDRISREIAYVPLSERIRSKHSSVVLSRGPTILNFGRASQRFDGFEVWMCFLEVQGLEFWTCFLKVHWIWSLDVLPRDPMDLNFGRTFQRSKDWNFGCTS